MIGNAKNWLQGAFGLIAIVLVWRMISGKTNNLFNGIIFTPATKAGVGSSVTVPDQVSAGDNNPISNLGYNFSMKPNNTFSVPGGSQTPTFLAYGWQVDQSLQPALNGIISNASGAFQ